MLISECTDGTLWNRFVEEASDATVMHLWGWKAIMEAAYNHRTWYFIASESGKVRGVLPLTLVKSHILGSRLVSMPFMDYGGACTGGDEEAERVLVEKAQEVARTNGASLLLRYLREPKLSLPRSLEKVTMFLDLEASPQLLWKRLPSERRNRIRKAQREGVTASIHGVDGLQDFYKIFATNMHDLGSPVHSIRFFREIFVHLHDRVRIVLVHLQGRPIGAGLMLIFNDMISIPWVSSLRAFFGKYPNQILYWEAMRFGIANHHRILDFGRSSRGTGTFAAKRQWSAEPVQLYWHYYPEASSPPRDDAKRLAWAAPVWRRLPLPLANVVGPWIRRTIPN